MTTQQALKKMERALKRLKPDQGRIARRNGRNAVKSAILAMKRALDREFPLERSKVREIHRVQKLTERRFKNKMKKQGRVSASLSQSEIVTLLEARAAVTYDALTNCSWINASVLYLLRALGDRAYLYLRDVVRYPSYRDRLEAHLRLGGKPNEVPRP